MFKIVDARLCNTGKLEIQGSIYHLETGRVEFLGRSPNQKELLASEFGLPPSVKGLSVRTTTDGPMKHPEALQILKDGNRRFVTGETLSGNVTNGMRRALVKEGQAPLAAIIGCADSRAPLETVFDAMPGDLFVLRNAGNTCTHSEGSMVGSLEFCIGALGTKTLAGSWPWHISIGDDSQKDQYRLDIIIYFFVLLSILD